MLRRLLLVPLLLLFALPLAAQSAGSFAGDFVGMQIIKTLACNAGDLELSCQRGGSAFLGAEIKVPGAKSKVILITGSLETAILTQTGITGGGGKQSGTATGSIVVRPEVTGPNGEHVRVWPPAATFNERTQTLTANLSGCITNPDSLGIPVIDCSEAEMVDLLLSTMSAHSFTFLAENNGSGVYTVRFHIGATAVASSTSITARSSVGVGVGVGSLAVQLVQVQTPFSSLCFDLVNGSSC
jgi:hypothetical protein